ncbi:MAG: hypothetical protein IIW71_11835 [Treponema sp.]|nr:hypothetical protein [Treponema sp.]MBQ5878467.1 hypothetical protein [Treponema sp.]
MEAAVGLATFQINDEVKNEVIKFLKSKDFENLSVKEKKEFMIELKNTSYSLKNLYNLFALSYERLLKKDDSTFSNLDTLMSVFAEEFKNIQMEEFENMLNKAKSKCGEITATKITLIIESDEDSNPDFPDIFMEEMLLNFSIETKTNIKSVAMEDL